MVSRNALKAVAKSYSSEAIYREVGEAIRTGQFNKISCYLTTLVKSLTKHGKQLAYTRLNSTVFRGIRLDASEDYPVNHIGYWPCFCSTSKSLDVGRNFARYEVKDDIWTTVFKINLSKKNDMASNLNFPQDWSYFPGEEEVLLMPGFCFMVLK